ncbi:hypothetical protein LTS08_008753 [Lithohypha guttulata]|uniref:Uncharacterized protein n=1 Tax=Lithohypha guttulata TaxID=1690604 RepID=A0AAN7PH86_9EURO|nr:hypothetical protein LTR05_008764 [Lithohypha guttulata]KAK5094070.1 hypothetical protein LTS08_008753 [Lithohypha guttulata]
MSEAKRKKPELQDVPALKSQPKKSPGQIDDRSGDKSSDNNSSDNKSSDNSSADDPVPDNPSDTESVTGPGKKRRVEGRGLPADEVMLDKPDTTSGDTKQADESAEDQVDEPEDVLDEKELPPVSAGSAVGAGAGPLFPGLVPKTVALLEGRFSSRSFVNQYGPDHSPWFVIDKQFYSSEQYTENPRDDSINDGEIQCLDREKYRVLDKPLNVGEPATKLHEVQGICAVVCQLPLETQANPMQTAKSLDPDVVKMTSKYPDFRARQKAVRNKEVSLAQFKQPVLQQNKVNKTRSWESSSKYRALHGVSQVSAEKAIYSCVSSRAERFLKWYRMRHPNEFALHEEASRLSPMRESPAKSLSPVPQTEIVQSIERSPPPTSSATKQSLSSKTKVQEVAKTEGRPSPSPSPDPSGDDDDEPLTEEEYRQEVELAWRMHNNVNTQGDLNTKQKRKFDTFYAIVAQLRGSKQ